MEVEMFKESEAASALHSFDTFTDSRLKKAAGNVKLQLQEITASLFIMYAKKSLEVENYLCHVHAFTYMIPLITTCIKIIKVGMNARG